MRQTHATTALTASQEDYLEAILQVLKDRPVARAKDIAERLGVKAASVTGALRQLAALGCVEHAPYDFVTLTDHGRRLASDVARRHAVLGDFLTRVLALPAAAADAAACRLEHALPAGIQQQLARFVEFLDACPREAQGLHERFRYYLEQRAAGRCAECGGGTDAPCGTRRERRSKA